MTDYGFHVMGYNKIIIRCATDNARSCAVAQRVGYTREGLHRQDIWINGHFQDLEIYRMLAEEWDGNGPIHHFAKRVDSDIELRPLLQWDADALFALTDTNRTYLREWLPWLDEVQTPADTRQFIQSALKQYGDSSGLVTGIWVEGELVGVVGFNTISHTHRKAEIGYWLAQDYTGQGIMTRAVHALIDYAFNDLGLNRIEIPCATGNRLSCAIPERLGFKHEGIIRQAEWLYDHYVDWNMYALLAPEWKT
jgi:ribosomal-protein-serine acetyltransferase